MSGPDASPPGGSTPRGRPRVAVHGLGALGAAQAATLVELGFEVIGHEPDPMTRSRFEPDVSASRVTLVASAADTAAAEMHFVCVEPTPAVRGVTPRTLEDVIAALAPHLHVGALVVGVGELAAGTIERVRERISALAPTSWVDLAWVLPAEPGADLVFAADSVRAESLLRGIYHPRIAGGARLRVRELAAAEAAVLVAAQPAAPTSTATVAAMATPVQAPEPAAPGIEVRQRSTERRFRPDIEGMRAVAVGLVVAYHVGLSGFGGGFVGVDVFFVISGFLITRQLFEAQRAGTLRLSDFYIRRMKRLLPAAAIVTLAVLAAARYWSGPLAAKDVAEDAFYSAIYGMNFHLAAENTDYLAIDEDPSPLMHFWSLSIEEQFYIGLPLLILALGAVAWRLRRTALVGMLALIVGFSLYLSITLTRTDAVGAYYSLATRAWEFGLGGLVAVLAPVLLRVPRPIAAAASWAGLAMIGYAAVSFDERTGFPGSAALLPVGGAALMIAAGLRQVPGSAETVLGRAPAQVLGKLSYSLYLWHWPVLIFLPLAVSRELDPALRAAAVGIALLLSIVTYAAVEAPLRRVKLHRPVWLVPGLGLSAATAATALVFAATVPALNGTGAPAQAAAVASPDSGQTPAQVVASAVEAGLATGAVPSNLSPALGDAEGDQDYGTGCHLGFEAVAHPACAFGNLAAPAARTMVLFGDSHAAQWFAPLNDLATARGWKLLWRSKSSCMPAQVITQNEQLRRQYTECETWRAERVAEIAALAPALVVAGQADAAPGATVSDQDWASATLTTLTTLRASGAMVVLLGDNPQAPHDPVECLSERLDDAADCVYPREAGFLPYPQRQQVLAAALRAAGFDLLPTTDWICAAAACPPVVGNLLTYRDDNHVSKAYSRWLAPMLEPIVRYAETRSPVPATPAPAPVDAAAPATPAPPPEATAPPAEAPAPVPPAAP